MIAVIGSTPLAERLADLVGRAHEVKRTASPDSASAEGRLEALASLEKAEGAVAATGEDERSLVSAGLARRLGAARAAAIVESPSLAGRADLATALGVDRVIQPEAELAAAVLLHTAGPAAQAVRALGAGRIRVVELRVVEDKKRAGQSLGELGLPAGARVALIRRAGRAVLPSARASLAPGDHVLLMANATVAADAAARLGAAGDPHTRAMVVAPSAGAERAERLARALRELDFDAATAAPDEAPRRLAGAGAVVLLEPTAKGVEKAVAGAGEGARVLAVDAAGRLPDGAVALSTTEALAGAVLSMLPRPPVERLGPIEPGAMDVYRVEVGESGEWLGIPLKELPGLRGWTILAIQAGRNAHLPHPADAIGPREIVIIAGPPGGEAALRKGLRGG